VAGGGDDERTNCGADAGADGPVAGYASADGNLPAKSSSTCRRRRGLGIEALSRGAAACTFVESDGGLVTARNLSALDVRPRGSCAPPIMNVS